MKGSVLLFYYSHICEFSSWKKCSTITDSLAVYQCSEYEYVLKVQLDTTAKSPRQVHAWKCSLRSFNPSPSWDFGYEQGLYYEKHPLVFISVFASHMRYVVGHNLIFLLVSG